MLKFFDERIHWLVCGLVVLFAFGYSSAWLLWPEELVSLTIGDHWWSE